MVGGIEDEFFRFAREALRAEGTSSGGVLDMLAIVAMLVLYMVESKDAMFINGMEFLSRRRVDRLNYRGRVKAMKQGRVWFDLPNRPDRPPPESHGHRGMIVKAAIAVVVGSPLAVIIGQGVGWTS
jgi:hypothetical protein